MPKLHRTPVLGERLKGLREKTGISQREVARRAKLHYKSVSRYEAGGSEPDYLILTRLAEVFAVSTDYLIGRTEKPSQVLTEPTRAFVDKLINLSDEQLMLEHTFSWDGEELSEDKIKSILEFARFVATGGKTR